MPRSTDAKASSCRMQMLGTANGEGGNRRLTDEGVLRQQNETNPVGVGVPDGPKFVQSVGNGAKPFRTKTIAETMLCPVYLLQTHADRRNGILTKPCFIPIYFAIK